MNDALIAEHIAPGRCACCGGSIGGNWKPREIIDAARAWHDRYGTPPKAEQWLVGSPNHPSFKRVRAVFGSWNRMLLAAGLTPRTMGGGRELWTDEQIFAAMWAWAHAHDGKLPTYKDWQKSTPNHPCSRLVARRFGSWNAAVVRAGGVARGPYGAPLLPDALPSKVDSAPIVKAVRDYLGPDGRPVELAELLEVDVGVVYKLLNGNRPRIRYDAAERILTAIARPDVLAGLREAA